MSYEATAGDVLRQLPRRLYTDDEIAEALKDFIYVTGGVGGSVTTHPAPDRWRTITVHHASIMSDAKDGWDVEIKEESL